jgi:protein TonB
MSSFASSVSSSSQVERRSHARRRINGLTYADFGADNGAIILDLAEGGLGFQSVTPVSLGQAVLLKFKLPEANEHVESYAEVAWLNDSGKGGGLRFVELNGNARVHIRAWAGADIRLEAEREIPQTDSADRSDSISVRMSSSEGARPTRIQNTASPKPATRPEGPESLREESGAIHDVEAAGERISADSAALPIPEVTKHPKALEAEHSTSPAVQIASPQAVQRASEIAAARAASELAVAKAPRTAPSTNEPAAKANNPAVQQNEIDLARRAHPRSQAPAEFTVPGIPYESMGLHGTTRIGNVNASASEITDPAPALFGRPGRNSAHVPAEKREQSASPKASAHVPARRPSLGPSSTQAPASLEWEELLAKQERELNQRETLRSQAVKVGIGAAAGALFVLAIVAGLPSLKTRVQATANRGSNGLGNLAAGQPAFQVEVADANGRRWMLTSGSGAASPFGDTAASRREAASAGAAASRKESTESASSGPSNAPDAPKETPRKTTALALSRPRVTGTQPASAQLASPSIFDGITPPIGSLGGTIVPNGLDLPRPDQPEGRSANPSQGLQAAVLLQRVAPVYPVLARQQHVTGEVHIGATIGKDGIPRNLKPINGDSRLIGAALTAINQWRYQPASVGGQPIDTQTVISVVFELK